MARSRKRTQPERDTTPESNGYANSLYSSSSCFERKWWARSVQSVSQLGYDKLMMLEVPEARPRQYICKYKRDEMLHISGPQPGFSVDSTESTETSSPAHCQAAHLSIGTSPSIFQTSFTSFRRSAHLSGHLPKETPLKRPRNGKFLPLTLPQIYATLLAVCI
jgi:hypothetical protein